MWNTLRVRHAGNEIDFLAPGVDGIDHDVPIRSPPLRAAVDHEVSQKPRREDRAMRHAASEDGLFGPEQRLAHQGMHTIGPDHCVDRDAVPVGKEEIEAGAFAIEAHEFLVEDDELGRHGRGERGVQIAAMHQPIWRTVRALGFGAEGQLGQVSPLFQTRATHACGANASRRSCASSPSARSTRMALGLIWIPAPMRWNWFACS